MPVSARVTLSTSLWPGGVGTVWSGAGLAGPGTGPSAGAGVVVPPPVDGVLRRGTFAPGQRFLKFLRLSPRLNLAHLQRLSQCFLVSPFFRLQAFTFLATWPAAGLDVGTAGAAGASRATATTARTATSGRRERLMAGDPSDFRCKRQPAIRPGFPLRRRGTS